MAFEIRPAREDEWPAAFRWVFQGVPELERAARIRNGINMVRAGELQREGIWIANVDGAVKGAMISLPVPGASALMWPPQAEHGPHSAVLEDALLQQCSQDLRRRGVRVAQCLLEAQEQQLATPLLRNGFLKVTSLLYLRHDLTRVAPIAGDRLRYESYEEADPAAFHATLEKTYEGTLDCPELNGVRTLDEIITGHKAQGRHDPNLWWLALADETPVAVLLVTEIQEWRGWDLSYLGVVASARRRGVARNLARKAIWEARHAGQSKLTLSVDCRNKPARSLYQQLGFVAYDQREVYLALWPAGSMPTAVP
jgi:ribosomal protein S18 acetylase RimI-like enzyme